MMNRRSKILAWAVVGATALLLADKVFLSPFLEKWREISAASEKADGEIQRSRMILTREKAVREDWAKVKALLDKPRTPDVQNHLVAHLGEIAGAVDVNFDIKGTRDQPQGDFKEYIFETQFKLKWEQLGALLVALQNSREFLKPARISVNSQYEKEDRLDVDLKISTIGYAPGRAK